MGMGEKTELVTEDWRNNLLEKELLGAIAAGKAPRFEVFVFDFRKQRRVCEGQVEGSFQVSLGMLLDGQLVEVAEEQKLTRCEKKGDGFEGRIGSVDLMERALRKALLNRWPQIRWHLRQTRIVSYSATALDYQHSHRVQVTFGVVCRDDQAPRILVREGVDTLGVTFDSLTTIYHWVAWRLLRRLRGEKRGNGKR